jgi:hypothetical protein
MLVCGDSSLCSFPGSFSNLHVASGKMSEQCDSWISFEIGGLGYHLYYKLSQEN